jgi:hypothetical protein
VDPRLDEDGVRAAVDKIVRQALEEAKALQKVYADRRRRPAPKYKVGDKVLVNRKALMSQQDREVVSGTLLSNYL